MKFRIAALATAMLFSSVPSLLAQANTFSDKDKTFLKDATEDSLAEIKLAELAVKTTKNPEIKMFASKMITDHKALIAGAKPVAAKADVTPPTSPSVLSDAEYLKLKVLSGETFDKSYVKTMVSDHHKDLDKTKTEHDTTQNADMKKLTAHASAVIGQHTKMIDGLAGKMGLQ